jgi:DMSO/TMAO reductase YedYZ molybdopterin-dependent catalytic subunit
VTTQPTTTTPFYDIDINTYLLDINGLVNTPLSLSYTQIQTYSTVTLPVEIVCPGEEDEWDNWTGVPLSTLLNVAGLSPEASEVVFTGSDGYFVDLPLSTVMEKGVFLAYQMNGQALSQMRGYPLRLVVGGSEGADWLRWVTSIQVKSNLTSFSSSAAAIQNLRGNIPTSGSKTCSCLLAATVANYELVSEKEQNNDQIDSMSNLNNS